MFALDGIRVLDFGRFVAGPYCATLLADFGADVIRVERPGGGEDRYVAPVTDAGEGSVFIQSGRNKRSLTLDPRAPGAREVMRRLVATADVVVVNVPDSALARMGLDYATLSAIKPDIILCNTSSFGAVGPWADRPGFDSVGQAMSGSAYLSGPGDVPYRTPVAWVDHATGLYAAFGAMVALWHRQRTGRGQQVGGSLLGSALAFSSTYLVEEAVTGVGRSPIGNRSFINGPTDAFRTRDGWIVVQVVGDAIFRRWVALMGEPAWLVDPRFATDDLRGHNGAALSARMQAWCDGRTSAEALDELAAGNVPGAPILAPRDTLAHPQVRALGILVPTPVAGLDRDATLIAIPLTLGETPATIRRPPPRVGEHNDEVLAEIGFDEDEIQALRETGTI